MMEISKVLIKKSESMDRLHDELTGNDLKFYKNTLIRSTDVERSFSRFKNIVSNNRCVFKVDNLKKVLMVQSNNLID